MDKNKKLFPQRLWELINDDKFSFCLRWSNDGQRVYLNRNEFELHYLQTPHNQFHTQKAISFVRQMNMYGFRKVDDFYYENDNFKRNCPQLIMNMVRRHTSRAFPGVSTHTAQTGSAIHLSRHQQQQQQQQHQHQHQNQQQPSSSLFSELHRRAGQSTLRQQRHLLRSNRQLSQLEQLGQLSQLSTQPLAASTILQAGQAGLPSMNTTPTRPLDFEPLRLTTCAAYEHYKQPVSTLYQRLASSNINLGLAHHQLDQNPMAHQNDSTTSQRASDRRYSLILDNDVFSRGFGLLDDSTSSSPSIRNSPQLESDSSDNIVLNLAKRPSKT